MNKKNNKSKLSKIKLVRKSYSGELYDSNLYLSKIPLIYREWIKNEKIEKFKELLDELEKKLDLKQKRIVYRNIARVKLKKVGILDSVKLNGYYDAVREEIAFRDSCSMSHEFLHMASSFYDYQEDVAYSGLSQHDKKYYIGKGLNEGYTELLNERFFEDRITKNTYHAYQDEVGIARMLELFFEDEKQMMNYYFECDLPGFIRYFEQFIPRREFIKLLIEIDKYSFMAGNNIPFLDNKIVRIYNKIYDAFIMSNPSEEKIKKMEEIIFEDMYMYKHYKIKEKKLIKK